MDKNSVLGLILIAAVLIVFSVLNTPSKEELEQARRRADSLYKIEQQKLTQNLKDTVQAVKTSAIKSIDTVAKQSESSFFIKPASKETKIYTIENNLIKLQVSSTGAKPYAVELKKYKTYDQKPVVLFHGDSIIFGFNFYTFNNRLVSTNEIEFISVNQQQYIIVNAEDTAQSLDLRLYITDNSYIQYSYILKPNSYRVDFSVKLVNVDSLFSKNTSQLDLIWQIPLKSQEKELANENTYTDIVYNFSTKDIEKLEVSNKEIEKTEIIRNKTKWIAYRQQFFSSVIVSDNSFDNASLYIKNISDTTCRILKLMKSELGVSYIPFQNMNQFDFWFYFGPNHYQTLKRFNVDLEELVRLGSSIIKWINRFLIIPVFNFLNKFISNYGIIILLLTIFIKLILYPLTYKSYLSMAKIRVLKPQIDEINARIPAEKAMERQQAIMALYKRVGVNPLGGCLPMLLQFPILIAMFYFFPTAIELRQQGFLWVKDFSTYDAIVTWSGHIPLITEYFGNHISLFNVLMTITTLITIRMNNQTSASSQTMPGMQTMMYIMPIIFMFVLNKFSSGLTYYYFLANIITIIQNEIFKRAIDEQKLLAKLNENKKKPVKKSAFQTRLEAASRKQNAKLSRRK